MILLNLAVSSLGLQFEQAECAPHACYLVRLPTGMHANRAWSSLEWGLRSTVHPLSQRLSPWPVQEVSEAPLFSAKGLLFLQDTALFLCCAALEASEVEHLTFLWHRGNDFHKDGTAIPLLFRAATVEDVKEFNGQHKTRRLWVKPGVSVTL